LTPDSTIAEQYQAIEKNFVGWAETQPDIQAAFVLGSRAYRDSPADDWGDLDIVVVSKNPSHLITTQEWVSNFGKPIITFIEEMPSGGDRERRVLYEGGLDVDFAILPYDKLQQSVKHGIPPEAAAGLADMKQRGIRILLDKNGLINRMFAQVSSMEVPGYMPPTQEEFLELANDFWYHSVWTAKHLRRGELWWAKSCVDMRMKLQCLRMTEWHARAKKGSQYDTWFRGRFFEQWADPRIIEGHHNAFAHYDMEDVWHALFATMNLFRWITKETAKKLNYPYPTRADQYVTEWVKQAFSERT
jgi:aminoglycoside 6-adenylyltransferase